MKSSEQFFIYTNELNNVLKDLKDKKKRKKQIPNLLTLSRGVAPFFTIPLYIFGKKIPAIIITSGIACTDFFDGKLARKYNNVTPFGKDLDAMCDKIFSTSLIIPLIINDKKYFALISSEAIISLITIKSKLDGKNPSSSILGKIKTCSLSTLLISSYISITKNNNLNNKYTKFLFKSTLTLEILSIIDYYYKNKSKNKNLVLK